MFADCLDTGPVSEIRRMKRETTWLSLSNSDQPLLLLLVLWGKMQVKTKNNHSGHSNLAGALRNAGICYKSLESQLMK